MSDQDTISLAVWDVPMPVVAGETFSIKVGAKSASGRALAGSRVEVSDAKGAVVASGTLGDAPWAETEALYWTALDVPAPASRRWPTTPCGFPATGEAMASRFSVAAAAKPEHTLTVKVTERDTAAALGGVEIRLGPFHARTDKPAAPNARLQGRVSASALAHRAYRAARSRSASTATQLALTMVHVPEEHPDARWVR